MARRKHPPADDDARRPVQRGLFGPLDEPTGPAVPHVAPAPAATELRDLGRQLPAAVRLGTSSWNFPGWRGLVYAADAPKSQLSRHGLAAYASHPLLRTVGVDRAYYAPVTAAEFAAYAAQVPADFRFLVKGLGDLLSPTRADRRPNPRYLDPRACIAECIEPAVTGLGDRLGTLLLQFPPQAAELRADPQLFADLLDRFLAALPADVPYAVELRDSALCTKAYADVLARHGARHGFVAHPRMPPLPAQRALVPPDGDLVVRWMLHPGYGYDEAKERYEPFDRCQEPDPSTRDAVAGLVHDAVRRSRAATVVINNKAEGCAPASVVELARHLVAAAGVPSTTSLPAGEP